MEELGHAWVDDGDLEKEVAMEAIDGGKVEVFFFSFFPYSFLFPFFFLTSSLSSLGALLKKKNVGLKVEWGDTDRAVVNAFVGSLFAESVCWMYMDGIRDVFIN